jgi:DNA-binding protein H-NS
MKREVFRSMSSEDLWTLHETISAMLTTRIEAETQQLKDRLDEVSRAFAPPREPRRYPKVLPKFQNPRQPKQTWAGRGKRPRWFSEMIEAGMSIDDLRIRTTAG